MKILIPMAGEGSRFKEVGYTFPKPIIEICGKPMIEYAIESFRGFSDVEFIFVVLKEHEIKFHLSKTIVQVVERIVPDADIMFIYRDDVSSGAAKTVLDALRECKIEDSDDEFIIANCDQKIVWDAKLFLEKQKSEHIILTFNSIHPRWSYAEVSEDKVLRVAEKDPISDVATVGIYYYKRVKDFVWGAGMMIGMDNRVNNEYYVCPVFNELIERGDMVTIFPVDKMYGLGTPEDVKEFERVYRHD